MNIDDMIRATRERNARGTEARCRRFDAVAARFETLGAEPVTAREMAADWLDAAEDVALARAATREFRIAAHQGGEGKLNGPDGTDYQQGLRGRSDLLGINARSAS